MGQSGKPSAGRHGKKEGDGDDGAKGGRMPGSQSPSTLGAKTKPKLEDIFFPFIQVKRIIQNLDALRPVFRIVSITRMNTELREHNTLN